MNAVREVEDILRLPYSSLSQDPSCQLKVTDVRNVAPKKEMICVSFNLPHSVAVSKPDESEVASSSAHCSCVSSTAEQLSFLSNVRACFDDSQNPLLFVCFPHLALEHVESCDAVIKWTILLMIDTVLVFRVSMSSKLSFLLFTAMVA